MPFGMGMGMGMGGLAPAGTPSAPVGLVLPDTLGKKALDYVGGLHPLAEKLEFNDLLAKDMLFAHVRFDERCWDAPHMAQVVLAEFSAMDWLKYDIDPGHWSETEKFPGVEEEIRQLVSLGTMARGAYRDEIIAQAEDATVYWANLLMANAASCPATCTLVQIAQAVGSMIAMYFKRIYRRPRPVQVYPPLMPLLLTPPHASYPNAHALQSNLMSRLLAQDGVRPDLKEPLMQLARRVGQNREIAGVHYPSDRIASEGMAPKIMNVLNDLYEQTKSDDGTPEKSRSAYGSVVERAKLEWADIRKQVVSQQAYGWPRRQEPTPCCIGT